MTDTLPGDRRQAKVMLAASALEPDDLDDASIIGGIVNALIKHRTWNKGAALQEIGLLRSAWIGVGVVQLPCSENALRHWHARYKAAFEATTV